MTFTAKSINSCYLLTAICCAPAICAASQPIIQSTLAGSALVQQSTGTQKSDAEKVDELLQHARQAMRDGKLGMADTYIRQAEQFDVKYDPLLDTFRFTPQRARQELEQLRQAQSRAAGNSSGQPDRASSFAVSSDSQPPASRSQAFTSQSPANGAALLSDARQALAKRDLQRATDLVAEARRTGVQSTLLGDSPAQVDALLQQFKQLNSAPRGGNDSAYAHDFAQHLMEQAQGLVQYQQFDLAESLVREAQRMGAEFRPFERTPDKLLVQIDQQRRQGRAAAGQIEQGQATGISGPQIGSKPQLLKAEALKLMAQARYALDTGDAIRAKRLVEQAVLLEVDDGEFGEDEIRPWQLKLEIDRTATRQASTSAPQRSAYPVQRLPYQPENDQSRNVPAGLTQSEAPAPVAPPDGTASVDSQAAKLFQQGLEALEGFDSQTALKHFREAWNHKEQLDNHTRQLLQEKLILLQANQAEPVPLPRGRNRIEEMSREQQLMVQKLQEEIFREKQAADRQLETDPRAALDRMRRLRGQVSATEVDPSTRKHFLTVVDRQILDIQRYIEQHRSEIESNELNRERRQQVELSRRQRAEADNKLAELVDGFNQLMDEGRFAEAEVIARQARELDPESPIAQNLVWKSRFARRIQAQTAVNEEKEDGFWRQLQSVDESSIGFDDRIPLQFDITNWEQLSKSRGQLMREHGSRFSAEEMRIQQALASERINVRFESQPLREVMDLLEATANVNIHLDPRGLHAEGVTSDTPVTLSLTNDITLKSALNLILEPLGLSYVIQNEVIKVTSAQMRDQDVYHKTYYVADLVIPIPNFVPSYYMGLPGALANAQRTSEHTLGLGAGAVPLTVAANQQDFTSPIASDANVLANVGDGPLGGQQAIGQGPGGIGGGPQADFDSLIELITTTIAPESWDEVGGPGSVSRFPTNLSLIISQTQEVHEQIEDLFEQLRRLLDLQVTIEVRFITLGDDFFERIGVDFDFSIRDRTGLDIAEVATGNIPQDTSFVVGLAPDGFPTETLNLDFVQDGFTTAVPAFGGFDAGTAANFGFAILSDIEVFLLLQASQGDTRSNVMQAPKVTLFNGQSASVLDISQMPFVTSVIPVVGDFAAAHKPVVVVLNEGTSLNVQAVVSSDRRFVRLTLLPFFSSIGDVQEFTFTGRKVARSSSTAVDADGNPTGADFASDIIEGTTVQLPTFNFTTVTTTVSVPDGGTVLLGGIKRLSEGRTERGVPLLNKVPYINRLFKNVGIGRETQSLMMMVTPRIIIQEEEELDQTGFDSSQL